MVSIRSTVPPPSQADVVQHQRGVDGIELVAEAVVGERPKGAVAGKVSRSRSSTISSRVGARTEGKQFSN